MLHWPIIYIVAMCLGMHGLDLSYITMDNMFDHFMAVLPQFLILFVVSLIVSLIVAYFFMKFDQNKIQPWLKTRPWYTDEQAKLEDEEEEKVKELLKS